MCYKVLAPHPPKIAGSNIAFRRTYEFLEKILLFLYSVNLTEYVAMEPRVCVCMYVCMCVCMCMTALQPKRMDGF